MLGVCAHLWQRSGRRSLPQAGLWWKCRRVVSAADVTETPRVPAVRGGESQGRGTGGGGWTEIKAQYRPGTTCIVRWPVRHSIQQFPLADGLTHPVRSVPTPPPPPRPPPPPHPPPDTHQPRPRLFPFYPSCRARPSLFLSLWRVTGEFPFLASASESVTGCVPCCMKC